MREVRHGDRSQGVDIGCQVPDYYNIVSHPMDLGTVKKRLNDNFYDSGYVCLCDIELIFHNCGLYNRKDSEVDLGVYRSLTDAVKVYKCGKELKALYERLRSKVPEVEAVETQAATFTAPPKKRVRP